MSTATDVAVMKQQASDVAKRMNAVEMREFIEYYGSQVAQSRMFGCANEAQGKVLAGMSLLEGIPMMEVMRSYHFLDGKLSMRADAMLADFHSRHGGKSFIVRRDAEAATIELERDGRKQEFTFTWAEAEQEPFVRDKNGGIKKNYATPRARMQMLWARCVSDAVRAFCPEVNSGAYTPEEISDFRDDAVDVPYVVYPASGETQQAATETAPQPQQSQPSNEPLVSEKDVIAITNVARQIETYEPGWLEGKLKPLLASMGKRLAELTAAEAISLKEKMAAKAKQLWNEDVPF
ncbi:recombinase RecT [Blastopirellula retiformator]|uniref:RecT family protein n=1 Tax=Blastopirellula retiformator TaxID=2527970 RepID=A0A5C5UWF7_9BACT|nr:recombinase RecT [Blastopirellula retiformator]TWT30681.1 hypothetical protein Enr8_42040 [Blastopirellula retiformator]